jgi:hypothetical protein
VLKGERGKSQGVKQLLADQRQGWMGIHHHEQRCWLSKSPSKYNGIVLSTMQGVGLDGNAVHSVNIAMNDL